MQIDIIENLDDLYNMKADWNRLFNEAKPGLFIHHSWVYQNYKHFQPDTIKLIAVYSNKRKLIGVFPFAIKDFSIKFLKFRALVHGGSVLTDYSQFMVAPEANRRLMIKRVLEKLIALQPGNWEFFHIDNLNEADDTSMLFRHLILKRLYAGETVTEITPMIAFDHKHEEAKKIGDIKRRFRKINGSSSIQHLAGKEITDKSMSELSRMHKQSFTNSGFDMPKAQAFYKQLIADDDFNQYICLSHIYEQDKIIASHFGFQDETAFYYYVPAYDEKYSRYGPGQYLLWSLVNRAKNLGKTKFDLLRGSEPYKFDWTNKINSNYTVFGVAPNDSIRRKILVNFWIATKALPFFRQSVSE